MGDKIFFSYSRFDSAFVLRLANDLRNAGGNIWLDQLDIPPGKHWDTEIENALNSANCVLAIISPKSLSSDNAMDEISYALEEKKRVIPILLTQTETSFRLRRLQRVDFTGGYDTAFKQLLTALNLQQNIPGSHHSEGTTEPDKEEELWKKCCQENTVSAYQQYLRTTTSKAHFDEAWRLLDMLQDKPLSRAINLPKIANTATAQRPMIKKSMIILGSLVLFAIIGWSAYQMLNKQAPIKSAAIRSAPDTAQNKNMPVQRDTIGAQNKQQLPEIATPVDTPETPKVKTTTSNTDTRKKGEIKPTKKQLLPSVNDSAKTIATTVATEEVTPPAPIAKKQVTINSRVVVSLLLIDNPDMHERKKTEQMLRFSVEYDVVYQGMPIIQKGAIAKGSLMIGSRRTDIRMYGVTAVDGSFVSLKSEEEHGRRDEVETNRHYRAIIKEGTRVGN